MSSLNLIATSSFWLQSCGFIHFDFLFLFSNAYFAALHKGTVPQHTQLKQNFSCKYLLLVGRGVPRILPGGDAHF